MNRNSNQTIFASGYPRQKKKKTNQISSTNEATRA